MSQPFVSSDQIVTKADPDADVLWRGQFGLTTATQGPGSLYAPYYFASKVIDLSFLNTNGTFPKIEVWAFSGSAGSRQFTQCPYAFVDAGTLDMLTYTKVDVQENIAKTDGYSVGLEVSLFHKTQNSQVQFYFTVTKLRIGTSDPTQFYDYGDFS